MKQTAINLTIEQYQKLLDESKRTGISLAGLIRLAVSKYFQEAE